MHEPVGRANIADQLVRPVITPGFSCQDARAPVDFLEEEFEIADIFTGRQKRCGALKDNRPRIDDVGDFAGPLPRERYLLCGSETSVEVLLRIGDAGFQAAIGRAGRRVGSAARLSYKSGM